VKEGKNMSNGMQRNLSQRKQVKSALERIEALEQTTNQIVMGVNEALNSQGGRLEGVANIVEAVVELFGAEVVDAKIKEIADRKTLQNMENAKKALEAGVADGRLVKADAISEKSLVVGRETKADGEVIFPGRVQLTFNGIRPEFQEKLKGQAPGFTVETPAGGKFEVLEVYDIIEKAPEAPAAEAATPEALDAALSPEANSSNPTAEA
jgi:hypothetical protein